MIIATTRDGHRVGTVKDHKLSQRSSIETEVEGIDLVVGDHDLNTGAARAYVQQDIENTQRNKANCSMYVNRTDLEFRNGILTTITRIKHTSITERNPHWVAQN
ncbi:MAG: hypothetical protein ACPG5T_06730 [Endozoicomonas sp.]